MSTAGPDPTMLELFAAEVDMHLPVLSEGLLALEKGRAGKKEIDSMMRAAHSIKGAARIVGIDLAVRIAHGMEDCFTAAKEERITLSSSAVDVLLQGVDALQRTCAPQQESPPGDDSIDPLLQQMAAIKEGKSSPPAAVPPPSPSAPAAPVAVAIPVSMDSILFPETVDAVSAETLRLQFLDILQRRPEQVRLDFSRAAQLNASALALLLAFVSEAKSLQLGVTMEARGTNPPLRALFRVVGLDSALAVRE